LNYIIGKQNILIHDYCGYDLDLIWNFATDELLELKYVYFVNKNRFGQWKANIMTTRLKYLSDVVTLKYDESKCTGCGICTYVCPHGVYVLENKKARITDRDLCMECGACANNCEFGAISVNAGVGCAAAIISSVFRKSGAVCCGPSDESQKKDSGSSCCG
jgi:NAD-dependent dihydropyrimidine dehydrogenase PreA subunit